jgi:hypothetical protein
MRVLAGGLLTCVFLAGCASGGGNGGAPRVDRAIAPLTETQFEDFSDRVSARLLAAMRAVGETDSVQVPPPEVSARSYEDRTQLRTFSRTLVAGLNDRLAGRVQFTPTAVDTQTWRSSLHLAPADRGTAQKMTFVLADARGPTELLRETIEFEPLAAPRRFAARPAPAARDDSADAPPPRNAKRAARAAKVEPPPEDAPAPSEPARRDETYDKIELDADESELGPMIRSTRDAYADTTRRGSSGSFVFLDRKAAERFSLITQRAGRSAGKLRVEFEVKARDKQREGKYRVVFFDSAGDALEATRVQTRRFSSYYAQLVSAVASNPAATSYTCLFQED